MPEIFGMHENANIAYNLTQSAIAINTILEIQPRDVGGGEDGGSP
jgi:dynein heavy chain